jgi:Acetyltransferase (GNAT) domain
MIHKLDPLRDSRWQTLVDRHPDASVFHTTAWLESLRQTYGYKPVVFTTSPPTGELANGLLFCRVQSWLTGLRMVSLPFSDHCEPLCSSEEIEFLMRYLQCELDHQNWKCLEFRPLNGGFTQASKTTGFQAVDSYCVHRMDLRRSLHDLFHALHKNSLQRRIHRAKRSGLVEKCGRSEELLQDFYRLAALTRRRHRLPPQPYVWFQNLIRCFGEALEIRIAYKAGAPVASILTLRFRDTTYYKYGGSDAKFQYLGTMPFLLWNAIAEAKSGGATVFDFGRTHPNDAGLMAFKNKWVPDPRPLVYWKFPTSPAEAARREWKVNLAKRVFSYMPDRLLTVAGRLIYPHIG